MRATTIEHRREGRPEGGASRSNRFRLTAWIVAGSFLLAGALACGENLPDDPFPDDPPEDLPPGPVGPGDEPTDDPPADDPPVDDPPVDDPPADDPPVDDPVDDPPADDPPIDDPPVDDPPTDDPPIDDPPVDDPPADDPPADDPPADPTGLPDLALSTSRTANTFSVGWEFFPADSCAFAEGCLQGTGWRRLLRFATEIQNIGDADVHLGDPVTQPDLFEYDACHGHFHLLASMSYRLLDEDGVDRVPGFKQSFCWGDIVRVAGVDGPETPNFPMSDEVCNENQGLTRGWADVYWADLDCQFLDITGLPPGTYTFRATVNENGLIEESDYTNNTIEILVEISETSGPPTD
jgi:hypothetical protein